MGESVPLGRIFGIRVGLNWSLIFVFWLVSWSLAQTVFPNAAPGAGSAAYWGAAVLAALIFYVSLLAHEIAHSLVARRRGMAVEGITLWLFGGVSRLQGDPRDPRSELRIAIVGPATSFVIAVVMGVLAFVLSALHVPALIVAVPAWLAWVNALLAVFNLLPAFPLDGGRVLRAILWRRRRDRIAATRTAARAGYFFGWLLGVGGVVELLATGSLGGIWLIFLGWFLAGAARAEATQSILRDTLRGMPLARAMAPQPVAVRAPGDLRVRDVMSWPDEYAVASPDEPLVELLGRVDRYPATRVLVVDGDRLVGIVSTDDVPRE
ncbi:MAG TPA: site-2 protease family protein [Candidatus Dormibacteraeota bacterium]|jgi:Zn-dependent protease|nr:site-2 protease family protein [Candidatus Dormibacteraeota bacterium]